MKIDPADLGGRDRYRLLISAIVPRPIAFVTTRGADGLVNLAPFSFFQGVSASPPTLSLAVSRKRDGSPKDTWRNIEASREFVVHTVGEDLMDAVIIAAAEWPATTSEVERAGLAVLPSDRIAVPRLRDARVALECRLHSIHEVHGVGLILGEILRFHVQDDVLAGGDGGPEIDFERLGAVARIGGDGYVRPGAVFRRRRLRPEEIP